MSVKQPAGKSPSVNGRHFKRAKGARILVIDPQPLFRDGLCAALAMLGRGTTVVPAAGLEEAFAEIPAAAGVDVVLAALCPASPEGRRDIERLRARFDGTPLILLLGVADRASALTAMDLRVRGCLAKTVEAVVAMEAVRQVLSGGSFYPRELLGDGEGAMRRPNGRSPERRQRTGPLTPRQSQVLALLREGRSNREIAQALGISEGTVKIHVTAILKGLGVRNRIQAVITTAGRDESAGLERING